MLTAGKLIWIFDMPMDDPEKTFRLRADEIKPLMTGMGACLASDRILVDGEKVGFMYREEPKNSWDSGWVFLAGDESQEYADQADNWAYYDVNTICNYDSSIITLLKSATGSAFGRDPRTGEFLREEMPMEPPG